MDFSPSPAQRELQERARAAVAEVVEPVVAALPPGERLDAEALKAIYRGLAPLGYLGSTIPRDAGGAGMSYVDYGLLLEALAASPVLLSEVVPPRSIFYLGSPRAAGAMAARPALWRHRRDRGDHRAAGRLGSAQPADDGRAGRRRLSA